MYVNFFSSTLKDAKRQKFLRLGQGSMTVEQYNQEFNMLSHFTHEMVKTKVDRANRFVEVLKLEL